MDSTYKVIILVLLAYCSLTDIKTRKVMMIPIWTCYVVAIIGMIFPTLGDEVTLFGTLPGIVLLIISLLSEGAIGAGDAYLAITIGVFFGAKFVLGNLFLSSLCASGFSLIMLVMRKIDRKEKIPFVPFMLGGYVLVLAMF